MTAALPDRYRRACPAYLARGWHETRRHAGPSRRRSIRAPCERDFPIFAHNPGLVFLDTAASAQKPRAVIDGSRIIYDPIMPMSIAGVYRLSARSTERYEQARETVRRFLNAADDSEIVFVRGATEAINLVAHCWGATFLQRRRSRS